MVRCGSHFVKPTHKYSSDNRCTLFHAEFKAKRGLRSTVSNIRVRFAVVQDLYWLAIYYAVVNFIAVYPLGQS